MERIMVMQGEEKAMAEKSPIGSLSMASKTQRSMRPPSTAWQETNSRVFRSGKERRLEPWLMMAGVTTAICRQHRSRSSCQGLTSTVETLSSLMVALLERTNYIRHCKASYLPVKQRPQREASR